MAGIRDPAFWKRFSTAVHLDEEKATPNHSSGTISPASSRPELKHSETWLERNSKKRSRLRYIGWSITLGLIVMIAAIVLIILYFKGTLIPHHGSAPKTSPTATASATSTSTPTATSSAHATRDPNSSGV